MAKPKNGTKKNANTVEGVDVTKARENVVDGFINKFKITTPANPTLEQKVRALARHLKKKTPDRHLADCDVCGGDSDVRLECCPYCGVGDEAPPAKADAPPAKAPTRQQAAKAKAATKANGGKPSLAIVPPPKDEPAKGRTEKDLDVGVARVMSLKAAGAVCVWELGTEIVRMYDERLYMLRKTKTGHGRYKNWSQFVQVELGMTVSYTYKLMDVAKLFTKKDLEIGVTKLSLLVQLPEAERKELLEKARDGMTRGQVASEVKELTAGKGPREPRRAGFKGGGLSKGPAASAAARRANEVTVATQLGRVSIPLYQRQATRSKDEPKRAKTLAQDPWGTEDLLNGVVTHYRVVKQAKGLALVVERRREEPGK